MLYSVLILLLCSGEAPRWQFRNQATPNHKCNMAKIKFGAIVTDIRGSIDSVTYSRSKYGAYARKKVTPVNPNTSSQSFARAAFGAASSAFRSLGSATIAAWNAVAPEYTRTNVFGDNLPLSGSTLYTKLKMCLVGVGKTTEPSPINPVTVPEVTSDAVVADVSSGDIVIGNLIATAAGQLIGISATAPVSAGRTFFPRSAYRNIAAKDQSTAAGDLDITAAYAAVFGDFLTAPNVGLKFRVRMRFVNLANGQPGPYVEEDVTIVA